LVFGGLFSAGRSRLGKPVTEAETTPKQKARLFVNPLGTNRYSRFMEMLPGVARFEVEKMEPSRPSFGLGLQTKKRRPLSYTNTFN